MLNQAHQAFFHDLLVKTNNFGDIKWLGYPIWQNILDLWTIQETICEVNPALLIECGTNRGGSARFFASLFDLMGRGRIITVDVHKMHALRHPRIEFLIGDSLHEDIVSHIRSAAQAAPGPVMVILDDDHSAHHVLAEMEIYGSFVSPGSFMLVQDGSIDTMEYFQNCRPGPLVAIKEYVQKHPEFEVDSARCERFLITQHPQGWLRRRVST